MERVDLEWSRICRTPSRPRRAVIAVECGAPARRSKVYVGRDGQRRDHGTDELRDLVRRQLQDFACQMAVGEPKFIQDREVIRLCDRDQVAGKMRVLTGKHGSPDWSRSSLATRPCHTRWKAAC